MATKNFTEIDTEKLRTQFLQLIEEHTGDLLYPGDERRILAESLVYVFATAISAANEQCKARLLQYAKGYQLDALGERVNCQRKAAAPATVKLSFTLATARPNDIIVPSGTTVTADNKVLFTTDEPATIKAGSLSVEGIQATATTGGTDTNGIPAGAIKSFVDKVPFVTGVTNTTESSGGDDGEPYPREIDQQNGDDGAGDEKYRQRIKLAPAAFSAAGTAARYEYYARTASANIEGVKVTSNQQAGRVDVYVTEKGGVDPTEGTIQKVTETLQADDVRALNDRVTVQAPEAVAYDIDLTYYVLQAEESASVKAIEGTGGAIEQYISYQQADIGRDINPDRLRAFLLDKCVRLTVNKPIYSAISDSQIARFSGNLNVAHIIVKE